MKLSTFVGVGIIAASLLAGCSAKAQVERHVKRGNYYFEKQELEKAKIEYLNAVRKGSREAVVFSRLGECFLGEGDVVQARNALVQARTLEPSNIPVRNKIAGIYFAVGAFKEAREEAEAILQLSPSEPEAIILLADAADSLEAANTLKERFEPLLASAPTNSAVPFALGILAHKSRDFAAARVHYEKALSLEPGKSKLYLALADLAAAQGDTNRADGLYKKGVELAAVKSWDRLRYAEYLLKAGRFDDAVAFLDETVKKEPDFTRALNLLSESMLSRNKLDEAADYNAKALAAAPAHREARLIRARIKIAKREFASAIKDLEEMLKAFPNSPDVQFQMAIAHLGNNDPLKALAAADAAVTLNPKHVQAILLRSEIQIQRNDAAAAIPDLTRLTRESPEVTQAKLLLATAHRQQGAIAEALPIYAELAKALPNDVRPYYFLGLCYKDLRQLSEARTAFENSLKISATFLPTIEELINLNIAEKKLEEGNALVQQYLDKYPDRPTPLLLKAKMLIAERKLDEAEAMLEKAIKIEPEFQAGHRALADVYLARGKRDAAAAKLAAMLKTNPKDTTSLQQLALLQELAQDYKGARASYETLLQIQPASHVALNNLANILSDHFGETDKAMELARQARDLAPADPAVADTFGWMLWKKGEYTRALGALQEAASKLPGNAEIQYHLGMTHYKLGAESQALLHLQTAVESKSEFTGKDRAAAALNTLQIQPANASTDAVRQLQAAAAQNPSDFIAHLRLAQVYDHQKEWDKAHQAYEAALKASPRSVEVLARLAEIKAFSLNNPQRGLEFARQAWSIAPVSAHAPAFGRIASAAGDFKWAALVLAEARRAQPSDPAIAYQLGLAQYAQANLSQAAELLQEASAAKNKPPLAPQAAALVQFQLNPGSSPAPAAAAVASALQADPAFPPALIVSGLLAEQKGDLQSARATYEQVIKSFPQHRSAQRQLALLLAERLTNDAPAAPMLAALRTDLPGDVHITKALGKIAYRKGEYGEAARLLRDCTIRLPNDADVLYHLGLAQYRLNERQAATALNRALELDANSALASAARKALDELK